MAELKTNTKYSKIKKKHMGEKIFNTYRMQREIQINKAMVKK